MGYVKSYTDFEIKLGAIRIERWGRFDKTMFWKISLKEYICCFVLKNGDSTFLSTDGLRWMYVIG